MAELIVEPEAEAELEEAGDRYEESLPGLGLEFLLEMRERTLELAEAPLRHPVFGGVAHDDVRGTGRTEARCGCDDLAVAQSGISLSRGDKRDAERQNAHPSRASLTQKTQ
jgi:hypothetical protein